MEAMLLDVEAALVGLPPLPLVIFGHSMGGRIRVSVCASPDQCSVILSRGAPPDSLLWFSIETTSLCVDKEAIPDLPKAEFLAELRGNGGYS